MEGNNPVEFPVTYAGLAEDVVMLDPSNLVGQWSAGMNFTYDGFLSRKQILGLLALLRQRNRAAYL